MRLMPVNLILCFGDGSHFDNAGDDHVMQGKTGRFNTLHDAGDIRSIAAAMSSSAIGTTIPAPGCR